MLGPKILLAIAMLCWCVDTNSQVRDIHDSGGQLSPEQAAYDVTHYDLVLDIDPEQQTINGSLKLTADVVGSLRFLVVDLDTTLSVSSVSLQKGKKSNPLEWERKVGQLWVDLGKTRRSGDEISVRFDYGGVPRVAPKPPWDGGFTWSKTPSGAHWVGVSCQGEGADLWWPVKDHVSDKPNTMDMRITVPDGLVAACNGRMVDVATKGKKRTYHWHISQPINAYNVTVNIAPYKLIETRLEGVLGGYAVEFYVLPEDFDQGVEFFSQILDHLRFFEELLGPYPFRADKYGVAQTPYLGMEHQSIIAYGADFNNAAMTGVDYGYDALHHHELAHEWWGNLVTNSSWEDMWLHEGFGTYMQGLYCEKLNGQEGYVNFMRGIRRFGNTVPVAPRGTRSSNEIDQAPIYFKGAWVLHTLRFYVGDEAFFESLRRMVYPTLEIATTTDGSQCRFVNTDDYLAVVEETSEKELDWFFEVYLRNAKLPVLHVEKGAEHIRLSWEIPIESEFPMPVPVMIGDEIMSYQVPGDGEVVEISVPAGTKVDVDPYRSVLCELKGDN